MTSSWCTCASWTWRVRSAVTIAFGVTTCTQGGGVHDRCARVFVVAALDTHHGDGPQNYLHGVRVNPQLVPAQFADPATLADAVLVPWHENPHKLQTEPA